MIKLFKRGLWSYKKSITLLVILLIVQTFAALLLPSLMAMIINRGVIAGDVSYILKTGGVMLAVALGSSFASIGVGYFSSNISVGFCADIRKKMFRHVDRFTLAEFDTIGAGSLTTRATNDILQVQNFLIMMFRVVILAPIMCIGGVVLALTTNLHLGMVVVAVIPVIVLFLFIVIKGVYPIFRSMQIKLDRVNQIIKENITGVRVVRAFTAEEREKERFQSANADMTQVSMKSQLRISTLMPMLMLIVNIGTVCVVWVGSQEISAGAMQVGEIMAVIQYLVLIMYALLVMAVVFAMMPRASVCAGRLNEVFDIEPQIVNPEKATKPAALTGVVEFKDVSLAYGKDAKPAVSAISFTAKPGETTAFIGATGSGKSTIICLIPRLRDVTQGSVTVDGVDVREYDLDALRSRIGYVPQTSNLFSGTIGSNIAFGEENLSKEKIIRAAKIAQAEDFILHKKQEYDDHIAQGGTNVSGGQRQRLAIARAIATEADILIFDDSFSALDFKTDAALRKAIKDNSKNATVIIVAQRINTILNADKILVLDKGKIVGEGKHDELLKTCPVYAEITKTQMAQEKEAV